MLNSIRKVKSLITLALSTVMTFSLIGPVNVIAATDTQGKQVVNSSEKIDQSSTNDKISLQILATSDSHGRFLPYDYAVNAPDTTGSLAQVYTAVKQLRAQNPNNTILVDDGDTIQDNSESLFINGSSNPMITAMNMMGYDTLSYGNHEFNYGIPALKNVMSQFKGKTLCGNVYNKDGSRLAAPYTIVERSGVKVGIIGMVTPNIKRWDSANLEGYKVTNPVDETKNAIAELKKQNINTIIAVEHMGETEEYNEPGSGVADVLAQCPEIDAFVAGHFHSRIAGDYFYNNTIYSLNNGSVTATLNDGSTKTASMDEYSTAKQKGTVIVEPNKWGKSLSQINISLTKDSTGKYVIENKGNDITTAIYDMSSKAGVTYQADPELTAALQPFNKIAIDDANTPIGTLKGGDLAPKNEVNGISDAKLQPTAMIDLINKVQMYYGEKMVSHKIDVSSAAMFKDNQNIAAGPIKKCDTANIYQFDNTLYVLKITGAQLKKYMEWSASYYNTFKPGDLTVSFNASIPGYNYDMFAGVKYTIDISKQPGSRIVNLTKTDGTAIGDSEVLYMTVNNYRASTQLTKPGTVYSANDSLPVIVGQSDKTDGFGEGRVRDLIGTYIQNVKGGTITPDCDNNWKVIGNNWNTHERALAVKYINNGSITLAQYNGKAITWDDVKKAMNPNGDKIIDVVSFNDFHGNLAEDTSASGKNPGMAKFVAAINEYKAANPDTVVVSGGDNYQGSAMSNLTYGEPVSAMMKQLGVTASAVGNHEFDWGIDKISPWAQAGNFDYLASNIYDKKTGQPVSWAKPYKLVTIDGVKIGFVGLTTQETAYKTKPDIVAGLEFRDPAASAKVWADKLKDGSLPEGKADVVIALTHIGAAQDSKGNITGEVVDSGLCKVDSLDAIVTAHTHNPVSGYVNNKPVVQAYYAGRDLADLSIAIDKNTGKVKSITPNLDSIYQRKNTIVADSTAQDTYNNFYTKLKPLLDKVEGVTDTNLTHDRFAEGTSILGQWVTDVMRKAVGVQIGITNGGGLREPIAAGNITMGDLYEVMPFDNTLVKMNLKGSDLKRVIENGIMNTNVGWVQVSGVKVYYDKAAPAGNRITAMFLEDGTPIDMNKYYSVVTNDFMATGGDQYDFTGAQNVYDTGIPIRDSLASALEALGGKHLVVADAKPLVAGAAPSTNNNTGGNGNSNTGSNTNTGNGSGTQGSGTATSGNSASTTPTSATNSNGSTGTASSTVSSSSLPKTGSTIDSNNLIEISVAAMLLGFAMIVLAKKKKEEDEIA
ncbi:5'-nucleotidase C-terminal domain-containing protein [Clostridium sp. C8-1-8]|uniref:5'-nucleotidase C-terminal domain-containing protein n=1 Tax=Clostridium sp. C8-1-8 TaxID=2698831 RepID=UPI00136B1679|nr:5'-nucleotidase C-terminal domain-containing protein [Clostridium sp. C8-1-8]